MPTNWKAQLAAQKRQNKALQAQLSNLQAQQGNTSGPNGGGEKRDPSPTEQIEFAASAKRARTKKHKGRKSGDEDKLLPTKTIITDTIQEKVFSTLKFVKGEGSTKKLSALIIKAGYEKKMPKAEREDWYEEFGDFAIAELNKLRSTVNTAIKGGFKGKYFNAPDHDIGTIDRWEACLNREIDLSIDEQKADYTFYYSTIMSKATGSSNLWNEHHKGYMTLCEGKPPPKDAQFYVTPETEAYALLVINGNLQKWKSQFEVTNKHPNCQHKGISKEPSVEAIADSNTIKKRLYMAEHAIDDEANLPADWLADMQFTWEKTAGSTNKVGLLRVLFAPNSILFGLVLTSFWTYVFVK